MMEYFIGIGIFFTGLFVGFALAQRTVKIQSGKVSIEARSVREVRAIVEAFKRDDFLMDQMKGPVQ